MTDPSKLIEAVIGNADPQTTTDTSNLLTAVLAVQAEAPTLKKDETATVTGPKGSYKYSYISLDTIVEKVGPILNKHGLVWMTKPGTNEHGQPVLNYVLAHAPSGDREEGSMPLLLTKTDPQGQGSAITYARRYALCAVLNLVADDDDDGNAADKQAQAAPASDAPSVGQTQELGRQMKANRPTTDVMREMLKVVGATDVDDEDIETGKWVGKVTHAQVDQMLGIFKSRVLPTGGSDIPNPSDDFEPVGAES